MRTVHVQFVLLAAALAAPSGCASRSLIAQPARVAPLGAMSDGTWARQEQNAEASKYVIYDSEFKLHGTRLNNGGADHVKQIAARLRSGSDCPVVIERTVNGPSDGKYEYPTNVDPALDMQRREVVVAALTKLGVPNAENQVVVAPAYVEGYTAIEAERAYLRGVQSIGTSGTFGGGFGGFGGFGGAGIGGGGGVGGGVF